jgi:hypothetical protein
MQYLRYHIILILCLSTFSIFGQGDIEDLLITEVDNINPVYKPVLGAGVGSFTFLGEVRDKSQNPINGTFGYKVNLSTFLDNKHYIRTNFYFMQGSLMGNQRSYSNPRHNLNFKSDILLFGINLNYDFDNWYKKYKKVHPFFSAGFEIMTFNSKTDSLRVTNEGNVVRYNYWTDGTIRNLPQTPENIANPGLEIIQRDYKFETGLRDYDWGYSNYPYPQYSFALPVEAGFDFWISNRLMFRVATSYHFVFSDFVDNVSSKNDPNIAPVQGNSWGDDFMFTYATLHLDLFSSKKTLTIERLFADVEWDPTLMSDEDNDGYFDGWDQCPGTPFGVETDTTGCPLDDDLDGVPNYLDDEPNSRYGAYVNERGVEIPEDELISMVDMSSAVNRDEVDFFIRKPSSYNRYKSKSVKEIPPKFLTVDNNNDGYISFDEMLNTIDEFFDFEGALSTEDIYELNNFFFSQ